MSLRSTEVVGGRDMEGEIVTLIFFSNPDTLHVFVSSFDFVYLFDAGLPCSMA